jgi:predicted acylesterase/phospholipase RssA
MAAWKRIEVGLVLQGGGALGAYEWGAIDALFGLMAEVGKADTTIELKAVTGVSIGAINGACIVGATDRDDGRRRLEAFWNDLKLDTPFSRDLDLGWPGLSSFAPARDLSLFGLPGFYKPRLDFWNFPKWKNLYDTTPLETTLRKHVSFEAIAHSETTFVVTAVEVRQGELKRFRNRSSKPGQADDDIVTFTPRHILASGSLAPQFPWTEIDGKYYWDGGIVDNTPLGDALEVFSDDDEVYRLLVVMNLFPLTVDKLPDNLMAVTDRVQELSYGNRLRQDQATAKRINGFVRTIERLEKAAADGNVALASDLHDLVRDAKRFKIAKTVEVDLLTAEGPSEDSNAARDFSTETLDRRRRIGHSRAAACLRPVLEQENFLAPLGQPAAELMEN